MAQVMATEDGWTQFELEDGDDVGCSSCGDELTDGDEVWIQGPAFDPDTDGDILCDVCWKA